MMQRQLILGMLVFVMSMAFGCGGGSMESMVNAVDADMQKMQEAAASNDEDAFLSAASNMANTMERMKPKMEKLSDEDKKKYGKKLMTSMMSLMDSKVQAMIEKIKSGSNADKWNAIEAKMRALNG